MKQRSKNKEKEGTVFFIIFVSKSVKLMDTNHEILAKKQNIKTLSVLYDYSYSTMRRIVSKHRQKLWPDGSHRNRLFTPLQIQILVKKLGNPGTISEINRS